MDRLSGDQKDRGLQRPRARGPALALLGASSGILQTVAVRESLAALGGNEAVIAIVLGSWLVLTGAGAQLARRFGAPSPRALAAGFALYGAIGPATLLAARAAAHLLAPATSPPLSVVALASAAILGPACLLSGWLYTSLARPSPQYPSTDEALISARAYGLDSLGSAAAGIALALVLLDRLLPFTVIALAFAAAWGGAWWLATSRFRAVLAVAGAAACAALALAPLDRLTLPWQLPGELIRDVAMTSRGSLIAAERRGQIDLLLQRSPIANNSPSADGDQLAHLSAAMVERPRDALFIGVAPAYALRALRAHGVTRIDEVVGDPRIARQVQTYVPDASDPGVAIVGRDERAFVRACDAASFDLVIIDTPEPTSLGLARLFSAEFLTDVRRVLRQSGSLVLTMPGHASYANVEQRTMHSTVASTIREVFPHVLALPADRTLYIGSASLPEASSVSDLIVSRMERRNVSPVSATAAWVRSTLTADRIADAARWSSMQTPPSTDVRPAVFRASLDATLAQLDEQGTGVLAGLVASIVLVAAAWARPRAKPVPFAVATTGFAGLALQLLVMVVYQTASGALFRDVALLNAVFLASTGVVTWSLARAGASRRALIALDASQLIIALAFAAAVPWLISCQGWVARGATTGAALLIGGATGAHIAFASHVPGAFSQAKGGAIFAADLVGASIASLLLYGFVVPTLGMAGAALVVAGVKLSSTVALAAPRPRSDPIERPASSAFPLAAFVLLILTASFHATGQALYTWTSSNPFSITVVVALALPLAAGLAPASWRDRMRGLGQRATRFRTASGLTPGQTILLLVLLPVSALPLARCYFRVPYVFCHACPRPCTFGLVRPYVVAGALLSNVGDRRFCERTCPIGLAQIAASRAATSTPLRLGRLASAVRWVLLAGVAVSYFAVRGISRATAEPGSLFAWAYRNAYSLSLATLLSAAALVALSFRVRRPFCSAMCPIGAISDAVGWIERRWVIKRD